MSLDIPTADIKKLVIGVGLIAVTATVALAPIIIVIKLIAETTFEQVFAMAFGMFAVTAVMGIMQFCATWATASLCYRCHNIMMRQKTNEYNIFAGLMGFNFSWFETSAPR